MKGAIVLVILAMVSLAEARDPEQVRLFREAHPCPSTAKITGACPNWVVDHVVPLCWGGADVPENMQWQDREQSYAKDQFERAACALRAKCLAVPKP